MVPSAPPGYGAALRLPWALQPPSPSLPLCLPPSCPSLSWLLPLGRGGLLSETSPASLGLPVPSPSTGACFWLPSPPIPHPHSAHPAPTPPLRCPTPRLGGGIKSPPVSVGVSLPPAVGVGGPVAAWGPYPALGPWAQGLHTQGGAPAVLFFTEATFSPTGGPDGLSWGPGTGRGGRPGRRPAAQPSLWGPSSASASALCPRQGPLGWGSPYPGSGG